MSTTEVWMEPATHFVEHPDHYLLDLEAKPMAVLLCIVDYAFTLEVGQPSDALAIRIEGPFSYTSGADNYELSADDDPAGLGPVLAVARKAVRSVTVSKHGDLLVTLDDDSRIAAAPDEAFEAWSVAGGCGANFVSTPGGGVAHWPATRS